MSGARHGPYTNVKSRDSLRNLTVADPGAPGNGRDDDEYANDEDLHSSLAQTMAIMQPSVWFPAGYPRRGTPILCNDG